MLIYILVVFFASILVVSFFSFKKDIIHPCIIFNIMFLASTLCALYNIKKWNINIHINTFFTLLIMSLLFNIISLAVQKYFETSKQKEKGNLRERLNNPVIETKKIKLFIAIIFNVLYIIGIIYFVKKIASDFGDFKSYSEALNIFKANTIYKANAQLPKIITLSTKLVIGFAYVYMFIGIYNFINSSENKSRKILNLVFYLMPAVLYSISLLLQSSRGTILRLIVSGIVIFIILWYKKYNYKNMINFKYIFIICISISLIFIAFYAVSGLIGRNTLNNNIIEYLTMYGGGSIQLFDIYLQEPHKNDEIIGRETFWGTYRFLDDYNIIKLEEKPTGSLEWRKSNGYSIGNVYTAYRRWIQDFGFVGGAIVLVVVCIFYNSYYNILKYFKKEDDLFNISLIFFAYMYYHLILISIDCRIFDEIIPASLSQFIVAIVVYYYSVKSNVIIHIKNKIEKIKELKGEK